MNKFNNQRGSILLIAALILYMLIAVGASFMLANVNEINYSRRYYYSIAAFWLAEAGINMFMHDPAMLEQSLHKQLAYGGGTIDVSRDDTQPMYRFITSVGTFAGVQKKIQITYPALVPEVYKNAVSSKGNISINGNKVSAIFNGQTRVSGEINGTSKNADVFFEDTQEGVDPNLTSLNYVPKAGANSFSNFVANNRALLAGYSENEIVHVQSQDTYPVTAQALAGKKIIYIEGNEGSTDVVINSNGLVGPNQSVTVITTGTVTFNQSGFQAAGSQFNIIAWGGYRESVSAPSSHRGLVYTHGVATFDKILDTSVTNGGVVADGGIVLGDVWSTKVFNYANMAAQGQYPPGFERLGGGSTTGIAAKPNSWKEISP